MVLKKIPKIKRSELLKHHPEWQLIDPDAEEINEISKNRHRKGIKEY